MTQSLYRIHGTWAQAYATLAANGLPGIEEGMTHLEYDLDGGIHLVTKGSDRNNAIARGSLLTVDIWQFDLEATLNDADPGNPNPDKRAATPVDRGPHLNVGFSNDDYRVDVVEAAWLAEPAKNHDTPAGMRTSWALQNRGSGTPEIATVHQKGTVAFIVSELIAGPRYIFSSG